VQDFSIDVLSPYTSHAIGVMKLSLEPSSARAPTNTLKFNVVMHEMVGFAEREGTEVHAQLFIPSASEDGSGVTTTQMIQDFDEGPIRFESVHSMSVPMFGPPDVALRVAVFAKVSSMHLDKLLSWDDMRDNVPKPQQKRKNARISESQFYTEEKHDVFARIQILELAENGDYLPVEVIHTNDTDKGAYQLHQGLQRRIVVHLTHSFGEALPWDEISGLRIGKIQLVDLLGKTPDLKPPPAPIPLKLITKPILKNHANGTSSVTIVGLWDSSVHGSLLLDRVTADKHKVQMSLLWDIASDKLSKPMTFSTEVFSQILSRSYVRSTSMFAALWQSVRIVHSMTGIFTVAVRPTPVKRAGDLWRMNTLNDFVKGEDCLTNWTPRGVSLIHDYITSRRRKLRLAELDAAKPFLDKIDFPKPSESLTNGDTGGEMTVSGQPLAEHDEKLLQKYIKLWKLCHDPITSILTTTNVEPPTNGAPSTPHKPPPKAIPNGTEPNTRSTSPSRKATFLATISSVRKNPTILKGGYLLIPSADSSKWIRRFVELRRPYLHIHSVPDGEEINVVSLRNSRVDHSPEIAKLLRKPASINGNGSRNGNARGRAGDRGEENVFAIYGTDNTWLFKARSEREKVEWIFKIDQAYFGGTGSEDD